MTTFALAPRPPPRDASPECSSSSCDATRPRPPRPGKGPRAGRTHRLASRTKAAPTDGGNDEENETVRAKASAQKNSFAKTFPAAKTFAPRPPAGAPAKRAFAPEEDVERSALLRAVRDAENESVSPKRTPPVTVSLERRKARNGGARRFGAAFDGNAPRTPPPLAETESKKKAFRRATRVAKSGMGRTGGGGGGGGDGFGVLYQQNEDCSPVAPTGVRTRERRERVVAWAPGGSAGVSAWGEFVGKTASPESGSSHESVSRESVSRNSARLEVSRGEGTDERPAFSFSVGQRTARAIDALRSTRRRAWSADASPYAASLSLTGTLPPARGARRSSSSSLESRSRRRDSNASANCKAAASVTPPKTLRARLERVTREARDWERKCAEAEVECDALRLETQRKDDAVSVLTRSLAEAEERLNAKIEKQSHGCVSPVERVSPVAEHLEAGTFRRYRCGDGKEKENVGDAPRSASLKTNTVSVERSPSSPKIATRSPVEGSSPVGPVGSVGMGALIRSPPSCGVGAVVEDSPPSAFFAFFPFSSPSRELDGVPAWSPFADAASPGSSKGTGSPPAPVPAADAPGVPAGFEVGGALSEDEDGTDVPGDGTAELRTPPAARRAGEVFERTAEAHPAEAREAAGSMATNVFPSASATPSTPSSSTPQIPSRASPAACASCAAARSRHEASEASCNALREALRATRRERETLESEKESLASRLAAAETDLSDAVASLHFERLDSDGDGKITLDDLLRAELFASYAQPVVERIFEQWTHSRFATTTSAMDDENAHKKKTHIDAESFRTLRDWTERKSRSAESSRFWFRVVDVDGDGVLSRHDIKWLYDAVYKDETTCVSLEDLTCQIFDMAGADEKKSAHDDAIRGGITCAAVRGSRLADGIFGILCNHDDMLLRRSTAEFSNEHAVPM